MTGPGTSEQALLLFRNVQLLERCMRAAVQAWPKSAAHRLTDDGMNQRAWLGWAAAGLQHGVPAHVTRAIWWQLSEDERVAANGAADRVMADYHHGHAETLPF